MDAHEWDAHITEAIDRLHATALLMRCAAEHAPHAAIREELEGGAGALRIMCSWLYDVRSQAEGVRVAGAEVGHVPEDDTG